MNFRRWENGRIIGKTVLVPNFQQKFDAPFYVAHRADLHDALLQRAVTLGAEIKVNSKVVSYDPHAPSVTLVDGSVHSADLIVAADGQYHDYHMHLVLTMGKASIPSLGRY